ncbi:MAG: glycosyltransferase family 39 protein [Acidimicrobiales bacterium]|nr:glycosyltransferase family 39 protein [Actinomycetota bacterium]
MSAAQRRGAGALERVAQPSPGMTGGEGASAGDVAPAPAPHAAQASGGQPLSRRSRWLLVVGMAGVIGIGVVLKFWTRSDLWLDEALTVDIARLPLAKIPAALRRDGAPPLYYVLLHFWMGLFGTSNLAVRSLAGVCGCLTMPVGWAAARRVAGRFAAWATVLLLATSPFATYYDTEARMYAFVALLTGLGFLALARALERPSPWNLLGVAVCTGALLYTHYWALYLVGVTGLWLLFQAWRRPRPLKAPPGAAFAAMAVGSLSFVPWLPTFLFQARHTGTPWAVPANLTAIVHVVTSFAGGPSVAGRSLALLYFGLGALALFGAATDQWHVELDLRTRPRARALTFVTLGTLLVAVAGGYVSHSAFSTRYASVVFLPIILLVALGFSSLANPRVRNGVLAVAVVAGIAASIPNITTNRTQAGQVAATLAQLGRPGDIVAYCPDQLGPAVNRLLPAGRYRQITFPRGTGPAFVDWVNYAAASKAGNPAAFAARLESMSAGVHQIWLVWAPGYLTFGNKCQQIEIDLLADRSLGAHEMFPPGKFYEPMELVRFLPLRPAA